MSIRPASGSASLVCASANARPHVTVAAAASSAALQGTEQAAKLLGGVFGGAEREHGNAELLRPRKNPLEPVLRRLHDVLAHAFASHFQMDLKLAVGHGHAGGCRQFALQGIVD